MELSRRTLLGASTAVAIEMANATHSFHAGFTSGTPTFAYKGADLGNNTQTLLGPVIVAQKGVPFELTVLNNLGAHPLANAIDTGIMGAATSDATAPRAAVHLHGGNTSPEDDGDPLDFFGSVPNIGVAKVYHYRNTQEAAGLWYHDHALGITRLNVYAGLASGYLIRDDNDPGDGSTGLPPAVTAGFGDYEVPLILQDRMFNPDGTFLYPLNPTPHPPSSPRNGSPSSSVTSQPSTARSCRTSTSTEGSTGSGFTTGHRLASTT